MAQDLFYVPIFFILFRETTEAAIIVSVLLSFLQRVFEPGSLVYKRLRRQVWIGAISGLIVCLCIGAAFIAVFYTVLNNLWGSTEQIWEAVFCAIAAILITAMGIAMLKTERMQEKWKVKLAKAIENKDDQENKKWSTRLQRQSFLVLPLITVLREGLEAVVFLGGVSLNAQAKSIPIAAIMGFVCGCLVGYLIYRGGSLVRLRWFFILSTMILYLVSAGLLSRAVGFIEQYEWNKIIGGESAEEGGDVIPYRVSTSVWHVSWGNPEQNTADTGGWQIFNAILGWNNTATIGTIVSYCGYWLLVSALLVREFHKERKEAIRKAESGEWEEGDKALEKAKNYIGEDGNILTDEADLEESVVVHKETGEQQQKRFSVERVEVDENEKH
ncbi:high-affinity iron permease [Syncephalastrum racemosum]|uniref:High-affinity iron permease n=1 Tax=Syncephalastrum racemosum TaxID=13706 RepID=A0A1X2H116_SYNRA|nr:high-affinity iron permease [Syncephalastrum racemosum]